MSKEFVKRFTRYGMHGTKPLTWKNEEYIANWQIVLDELEGNGNIKTVLNIGVGRPRKNGDLDCVGWTKLLDKEVPSIESFVNLEIDEHSCRLARKAKHRYVSDVVKGDVRDIADIDVGKPIDLVLWSHGPEHIYRRQWKDTFAALEKLAARYVILQVPIGKHYNYDPGHISPSIQEGEFEKFGYTTLYEGRIDTPNSSAVAFKNTEEVK